MCYGQDVCQSVIVLNLVITKQLQCHYLHYNGSAVWRGLQPLRSGNMDFTFIFIANTSVLSKHLHREHANVIIVRNPK